MKSHRVCCKKYPWPFIRILETELKGALSTLEENATGTKKQCEEMEGQSRL